MSKLSQGERIDYLVPVDALNTAIDTATPPVNQVSRISSDIFLQTLAQIMGDNPPHFDDQPILARMQRGLDLLPGKEFDTEALPVEAQQALENSLRSAQAKIDAKVRRMGDVYNGWQYLPSHTGAFGTDYLFRAAIAQSALGATVIQDALYLFAFVDSQGNELDGSNQYTIHFKYDEIPPVYAFWSLTLYDGDQFFYDNPLNRYALGDRDVLYYNDDGTLDIYIQHTRPHGKDESNWLPAPTGKFSLAQRLFWPKSEALEASWRMPAVTKFG